MGTTTAPFGSGKPGSFTPGVESGTILESLSQAVSHVLGLGPAVTGEDLGNGAWMVIGGV